MPILKRFTQQPAEMAAALELGARANARPRAGPHCFRGWIVTGVMFASGHLLALRRFPASTLGPAFTSVWHRDPAGTWTFHTDVEPGRSCSRFFDTTGSRSREDDITFSWTDAHTLTVNVLRARISWAMHIVPSPGTRLLGMMVRATPAALRRRSRMRAAMNRAARGVLADSRFDFDGVTPTGHRFTLDLEGCWLLDASVARIDGRHLGPVVVPRAQARLGELWIPCTAALLAGTAHFGPPAPVAPEPVPPRRVLSGGRIP